MSMDSRRQQQFPPLLQTQAGRPPLRQHLPPPQHMAMAPRPSSFSAGPSSPLSGHKRSNMALYNRPSDGPNFAKLFVGSLPRNISEEEVRDVFSDYGNILEVVFLKDKKTGMSQGCCFIKFSSLVDAERAIRALDNQRTLKGASEPLQVKIADGDRDHSGPFEHKLFVGSASRQANEHDIEEIFAPFGRVENVYVIRNENKQSRGCAFVSFPEKEMAFSAISALDGVYRMAGCHQPLIVRFADPKRPRSGEGRMGNLGTNHSPHAYHGGGGPRGSGGQPMRAQNPGFGWRQGGVPNNVGFLSQTGILPFGGQAPIQTRGGPLEGPNPISDGRAGVGGIQASAIMAGQLGMAPQFSQQPVMGPHDSPLQRSGQEFGNQHLLQQGTQPTIPHVQPVQGIPVTQPLDKRGQQLVSAVQFSSAQLTSQIYGGASVSHHQSQPQFTPSIQHPMSGVPTQQLSLLPLHQQTPQQSQQPIMLPMQQGQQQVLPVQPFSSQLQQPMIVKDQPLPSQLQQQTFAKDTVQQPYLQPSQMTTQQPVMGTLQPSWSAPVQQQVVAPLTAPTGVVSAAPAPAPVTCDWTEHTSPEGHKYYYNSSTGESRWEKPEEFTNYEKQKLQQQQFQLPQQHQQQELQVQAQQHSLPLQSQFLNPQYQLASQQSQPSLLQPYTQNLQPYQQQQQLQMQQLQQHHHLQMQQPQLQQLQQQQQPPPSAQQQATLLQQPQPQASSAVLSVPFAQSTSGAAYQPVQAYGQLQPAVHQQFSQSQQAVSHAPTANGTSDLTRGGQWIPAGQQVLPNQDWTWKSKPMGS